MGAILLDLNTGDPYLDEKCNTVSINNKRAFEQVIDGLFNCDIGSEPMNPFYGFDLQSAMRETPVEGGELFIESLVAEALNERYEKLISSVDYIEAYRDGSEMKVIIVVSSILQDVVETELSIG